MHTYYILYLKIRKVQGWMKTLQGSKVFTALRRTGFLPKSLLKRLNTHSAESASTDLTKGTSKMKSELMHMRLT